MTKSIQIGYDSGSMVDFKDQEIQEAIVNYAKLNEINVKDVMNDPHIKVKQKTTIDG